MSPSNQGDHVMRNEFLKRHEFIKQAWGTHLEEGCGWSSSLGKALMSELFTSGSLCVTTLRTLFCWVITSVDQLKRPSHQTMGKRTYRTANAIRGADSTGMKSLWLEGWRIHWIGPLSLTKKPCVPVTMVVTLHSSTDFIGLLCCCGNIDVAYLSNYLHLCLKLLWCLIWVLNTRILFLMSSSPMHHCPGVLKQSAWEAWLHVVSGPLFLLFKPFAITQLHISVQVHACWCL